MTLVRGQGVGTGLLCPCPHGLTLDVMEPQSWHLPGEGAGSQAGRAKTGEGALAAAMETWRDTGGLAG